MLAKPGATLDPLITELMPPSIHSVKTTLDSIIIRICVKRWEGLISSNHKKNYKAKQTKVLQSLVGVLTGHYLVGTHSRKISLVASDISKNAKNLVKRRP